ncbi:MAG: ChbG/HpnK family deacetylase [Tepidisphaeraceae bacterium]
MRHHVIFNADDFGASQGINRGIMDAHVRGVVTSTSLMVTGRAAGEAVAMSRDCPKLGIGLHWDVWGEDERPFDLSDHSVVRTELRRQLDEFVRLVGRPPTHVDSHRHAHREAPVMDVFREVIEPLDLPLRHTGQVRYVGGFYAQWEWMVTELRYISVEFLQQLLREETGPGWTEIACHPGYVSDDFKSVYLSEREEELKTLTDPRIRQTINDLQIGLRNFADYAASSGERN